MRRVSPMSQRCRPVASEDPRILAGLLTDGGVPITVIGSAASPGAAHDLDVELPADRAALAALAQVVDDIGVGDWHRALRWFAAMESDGVVTVQTVYGPLDLHRRGR